MKINKRFQKYIDEKNMWARITKQSLIVFPLTQENVDHLVDRLGSDLSPENLHCDGEISVSAARARGRKLMGVFKDINTYSDKNGLNVPELIY